MNIIDILHKLGYDVLSFDGEGHYKVQFCNKRLEDVRKHIEAGGGFDGDPKDIWEIYVDEVGFNGFGDLYVSFNEVGTDDGFDMYEYRNMDKIYD